MGSVWRFSDGSNIVYATKTHKQYYKETKDKKLKLKRKIENVKKVSNTLVNFYKKLKKWQHVVNQQILTNEKLESHQAFLNKYAVVKEKSLNDFQNIMFDSLVNDLNENIENAKVLVKSFGWSCNLINLIFKNGKTPNIKFKKMGCCSKIIIQIIKEFKTSDEKYSFLEKLNEIRTNETTMNKKIFLNPNTVSVLKEQCVNGKIVLVPDIKVYNNTSDDAKEFCKLCIILMSANKPE